MSQIIIQRNAPGVLETELRDRLAQESQQRLESLLLEGVQSGPGVEATPEYWANLKAEFLAKREAGK